MRRPSPTQIPELPAPPRRKRSLSEEERALWESVAKQTKPLRKRHRAAKEPALTEAETPATAKLAAAPRTPQSVNTPLAPKPQAPAAPPLAPLGRRERSQLSRGQKEI